MSGTSTGIVLLSTLALTAACFSGLVMADPSGVIANSVANEIASSSRPQALTPYAQIITLTPNPAQLQALEATAIAQVVQKTEMASAQATQSAQHIAQAAQATQQAQIDQAVKATETALAQHRAEATATAIDMAKTQAVAAESMRQTQVAVDNTIRLTQAVQAVEQAKAAEDRRQYANEMVGQVVMLVSAGIAAMSFLLAVGLAIRIALDARRREEAAAAARMEQERMLLATQAHAASAEAARLEAEQRQYATAQRRQELANRQVELETIRLVAEQRRLIAEAQLKETSARLLLAQRQAQADRQAAEAIRQPQSAAVVATPGGPGSGSIKPPVNGANGSANNGAVSGAISDSDMDRQSQQGRDPDIKDLPLAG